MTDSPTAPELVPQQGIGEPDGFARLWTPHRLAYIQGGAADPEGETAPTVTPACPFCQIPSMADKDALVIARGDTVYAVLNLYPYNPGHLMVVPYRHIPDYTDLTTDEITEFSAFTRRALQVVRAVSGPDGFNIGINVGAAGGAGIAPHLHQHLVPRWSGDANFMPVIGHTKVLPQLLGETRDLLAGAW